MKKIFVYTVLCVICAVGSMSVRAQVGELQMRAGYNTAMPLGSFKDFMGKNSFRGYFGDLTYGISDRFRLGLGIQFNDYYEKLPRQVYETHDGTISAVVTNSVQTTPVLVKASYELTDKSWVRPYVGLGAGLNVISFNQYLGEFNTSKSAVKPAVSGALGVNIPFNRITRAVGVDLGLHYNYLPFDYNGVSNLSNWGVHAGLFFPLGR